MLNNDRSWGPYMVLEKTTANSLHYQGVVEVLKSSNQWATEAPQIYCPLHLAFVAYCSYSLSRVTR